MSSKSNDLAAYIYHTVGKLQEGYKDNSSWAKERLATLRHVANRSIGDSPETWDVLYDESFPESLIGMGQNPTRGEQAAALLGGGADGEVGVAVVEEGRSCCQVVSRGGQDAGGC